MPFDFSSFRKLLFQDALEEAIHMLSVQGPEGYAHHAASLLSQFKAWKKSSAWNPMPSRARNGYHERIVRNLYQSGLAASKNEPPPAITMIHPWRNLLAGYGLTLVAITALGWWWTYTPPCPALDISKGVSVIIDRFSTQDQPFLQKIGLNKESAEHQIFQRLNTGKIDVTIHPLGIQNETDAEAKCRSCGAQMVIYGDIDYGVPVIAFLRHYINGENYNFTIPTGFGEIQEEFSSVFALHHSEWAGQIYELALLFQGLIAKKMVDEVDASEKAAWLMTMDTLFQELAGLTTDDSMKVFALHCLAWSANKQELPDSAMAAWNRILDINPDDKIALHNAGFTNLEAGHHVLANEQFSQLLEKDTVPHVYLAKIRTLQDLKDTTQSRAAERRFKKTDVYRKNPERYEQKIEEIHKTKPATHGSLSDANSLSSSAVLDLAVVDFNTGRKADARRKLDRLSARLDTTTLTTTEIEVISRLYRQLGEQEKATSVDSKVVAKSRISTTSSISRIRNQ